MSKRFVVSLALQLTAKLQAEGVEACVVPPSTSLFGGCSDPEHCPQHPGTTVVDGQRRAMLSIRTEMSGSQLSKRARSIRESGIEYRMPEEVEAKIVREVREEHSGNRLVAVGSGVYLNVINGAVRGLVVGPEYPYCIHGLPRHAQCMACGMEAE